MTLRVGKAKAAVPLYDNVFVHEDDVTDEIAAIYGALKIDANNLAEELINHAMLFARIGLLSAEVNNEARYAKRRVEIAKAEANKRIRREASMDGGKKPTEDEVKNMVVLDEEVSKLTEEQFDTERDADVLGVLKQSVKDRRETMIELSRNQRSETNSYGGGE